MYSGEMMVDYEETFKLQIAVIYACVCNIINYLVFFNNNNKANTVMLSEE